MCFPPVKQTFLNIYHASFLQPQSLCRNWTQRQDKRNPVCIFGCGCAALALVALRLVAGDIHRRYSLMKFEVSFQDATHGRILQLFRLVRGSSSFFGPRKLKKVRGGLSRFMHATTPSQPSLSTRGWLHTASAGHDWRSRASCIVSPFLAFCISHAFQQTT